jgi:hypothetical protein
MRASPDARRAGLAGALALAGFVLTLIVFYPGIMTYDAKYVYLYIKGGAGDWQSPVMTWLWSVIDPVAPGPGSMFLLISGTYWIAFGLLSLKLARRSVALEIALPFLALAPPALSLLGVIWRDVLFAATWLLAAVLAFHAADARGRGRLLLQIPALILVAFGVLLRPNALIAAPLLALYAVWPAQFRFKRVVLLYLPTAIALYALVPLVYYGVLGAKHEHPLHSIMVFDLGGISHFAKQNVFPSTWSPQENALIVDGCYKPTLWDLYWNHEPCKFVMARLDSEKIFGTATLVDAWRAAVMAHPLAYLQHRAAFMTTMLTDQNLTMWTINIEDYAKSVFPDRPAFAAFRSLHDALQATPLYRGWFWLLGCTAFALTALRRRGTAEGAFVIAVCGSATLYVLTFFLVGVAPDFRFVYWAVLAALGGVLVLSSHRSAT